MEDDENATDLSGSKEANWIHDAFFDDFTGESLDEEVRGINR